MAAILSWGDELVRHGTGGPNPCELFPMSFYFMHSSHNLFSIVQYVLFKLSMFLDVQAVMRHILCRAAGPGGLSVALWWPLMEARSAFNIK